MKKNKYICKFVQLEYVRRSFLWKKKNIIFVTGVQKVLLEGVKLNLGLFLLPVDLQQKVGKSQNF